MNSLRIAIADDEPIARLRLRRLLALGSSGEVVGEYGNAEDLAAGLAAAPADVLLLDIEMPGCSGFEAIARLRAPPAVVFVTAYRDYAVDAFGVDAIDYLLKPVSRARLEQALAKVVRFLSTTRDEARESGRAPARPYPARLAVQAGRRIVYVRPRDIDFVRACANHVEVQVGARALALRQSLRAMERQLDPGEFVRVHRSALVRIDAIRHVRSIGSGRYSIALGCGRELLAGRRYAGRLLAALRGGARDPRDDGARTIGTPRRR